MKSELKRSMYNFYDFKVEAKNPKTNEIKMVNWFEGSVIIEKDNRDSYWIVKTISQKIANFWLEKFGDIGFCFKTGEEDNKLKNLLNETAMFVDAPYIEGCALTKEWIRYEIY